nr:hypothetical protein [uncultured Treponema sp.]
MPDLYKIAHEADVIDNGVNTAMKVSMLENKFVTPFSNPLAFIKIIVYTLQDKHYHA